ncbi:hypothetical protein [Actinokineospora sp. NPDC004072]
MPPNGAQRRLCVAVDARRYSQGDDHWHLEVHHGLLGVLDNATAASGLNRADWDRQQAGDSELAVLPADTDEVTVVDRFIREMDAALARHNARRIPDGRLRLRLAIHFGRVVPGPNGYAGPAPIEVSRLLDSADLRSVLEDHPAANLAVALSDEVYGNIIASNHTTWRPEEFVSTRVSVKEFTATAWLLLPGHPLRMASATSRTAPAPPPEPEPGPAAEDVPPVLRTTVGTVNATDVVFGIRNG